MIWPRMLSIVVVSIAACVVFPLLGLLALGHVHSGDQLLGIYIVAFALLLWPASCYVRWLNKPWRQKTLDSDKISD